MSRLPWAGPFALVINACISFYRKDTPYFPIEMSKIANNSPQCYIFFLGMLDVFIWFCHVKCERFPFLPMTIQVFLAGLVLASDQHSWVLRVYCATGFFLLCCLLLFANGVFNRRPYETILVVGFVLMEKWIGLCIVLLYGQWTPIEPDYITYMRQVKGLAQWFSIIGLLLVSSDINH